MCDFQYLPVIKLPDGQYKEILSSIKPKIDDDREEYLSRKVPLYLPPFCFSRRETPTNFFFENEVLTEGETAIGSGWSFEKIHLLVCVQCFFFFFLMRGIFKNVL